MFRNPEQFLQEKLTKKYLSINTIRDGVIAALLIALQSRETRKNKLPPKEQWTNDKGREIRTRASEAFASVGAPFEYPSLPQLQSVTEALKTIYFWTDFSEKEKETFNTTCQSLYSKFDDD